MNSHASQPLTSNLRMGFLAGTRHLSDSDAEAGSVSDDESSFFFILTVIVASISALYFLICILQLIHHHLTHYCCKRDDETAGTVLVHEGRIFNLAGSQRRAVLEAIFSETSKAIVDAEKNTGKSEEGEDSDTFKDVEIPGVSTARTEDDDSVNADCNTDVVATVTSPIDMTIPIPPCRSESWAATTSEYTYDNDSTGDNVCPICLSGYQMGEMLVVSKYCTHEFHKDCILEWLEKHADCPLCRVSMVTDSELNKAASSLIGKMRMCKAVASFATASPPQRSSSSVSRANQPSPFQGTVRRYASMRRHYSS